MAAASRLIHRTLTLGFTATAMALLPELRERKATIEVSRVSYVANIHSANSVQMHMNILEAVMEGIKSKSNSALPYILIS